MQFVDLIPFIFNKSEFINEHDLFKSKFRVDFRISAITVLKGKISVFLHIFVNTFF